MRKYYSLILLLLAGLTTTAQEKKTVSKELIGKIRSDTYFPFVKAKALEIMKAGFNAGDGYEKSGYGITIHSSNWRQKLIPKKF